MKERVSALIARIDALSLRERAIGYLGVLGILYLAWDALLFSPLDAQRTALMAQSTQVHREIQALNAQAERLVAARVEDPDIANRTRLHTLRTEAAHLRKALERVAAGLVPPEQMAGVLEAVLDRETALSLLKLEGLGVAPVLASGRSGEQAADEPRPAQASARVEPALFKHGLRVEFEGGYLDTLNYLLALERMSWRFLWDSVRFEVRDYPAARVAITVYSLSLDDAWIGV